MLERMKDRLLARWGRWQRRRMLRRVELSQQGLRATLLALHVAKATRISAEPERAAVSAGAACALAFACSLLGYVAGRGL